MFLNIGFVCYMSAMSLCPISDFLSLSESNTRSYANDILSSMSFQYIDFEIIVTSALREIETETSTSISHSFITNLRIYVRSSFSFNVIYSLCASR